MKTKKSSKAAADTLGELAKLADLQNGKADQTGKPGLPLLPEPEPESEYDFEGEKEDVPEQDNKAKAISFTEKDRNDFPNLEAKVLGGQRRAFESLRAIRWRQLWRLIVDDQGNQLYSSFDAYCEVRWGHTRQWVTHGTNWLRIIEELERLNLPVKHLTVKAAQGLLSGRLEEAGGLAAVMEEAKEDGVPLDRDHLREIVIRRADFTYLSREGHEGTDKPVAADYGEYKKDLAIVSAIQSDSKLTSYGIIAQAKKLDGDFSDNLVALCQEERKLPMADGLMAMLTGAALENVVAKLQDIAAEQAEIEKKKEALAARRKEIRARQQDPGLRQLKQEEKALKEELKAKGALKAKSPQSGLVTPQGKPEEEEAVEASEVYTILETALAKLEEAVTAEWPAGNDELNSILVKAQDCELKLAEVANRAKGLLADAEQQPTVTCAAH